MVGVNLQERSQPLPEEYQYLFKIALIGSEAVGKSSLAQRFVDKSFDSEYRATIGVDFKIANVSTSSNEVAKVQIWDTAGQERFRVISHAYYRGAHGIMLVFDVTKESSFHTLDNSYKEIKEIAAADCCILLVGTHSDLSDKREITQDQAEDFASKHGLDFIEVSSKTDDNISRAFQKLTDEMMKIHVTKVTALRPAKMRKMKKRTSVSTDEESLHELPNKSSIRVAYKYQSKKSGFCAIL